MSAVQNSISREWEDNPQTSRKYLQKTHVIRTVIQNTQKFLKLNDKQKCLINNWVKGLKDTSSKKICRWKISMWNNAPYCMPSEKCKLKPQLRYYYTTIKMAKIQNTSNTKCWQGYGATGTPHSLLVRCKMVQALWKTVWQSLTKLNIHFPYDPANAVLGI